MNVSQARACVLVLGAHGFIGRHLAAALHEAGYEVVAGCRQPTRAGEIAIDFSRDTDPACWRPRLKNVDIVINAVGLLHEAPGATFDAIHYRAPAAAFRAAVDAGVRRVIQISALGIREDGGAETLAYFASKAAADAALLALPIDGCVLRPSLVFGIDGASTRAFLSLASLPVHCLPETGEAKVQPIHIDDLCALILVLLAAPAALPRVVPAVGAEALTLAELLATYRAQMQLGRALTLALPLPLARLAVSLAERLPQRVATRETLAMLLRGNTAPKDECARWLGREPMAPREFLNRLGPDSARHLAIWSWAAPTARLSLALLWLISGWSGLIDLDPEVTHWLARLSLQGAAADATRLAASAVDLALAAASLLFPSRRLFALQMALIALYTVLASMAAPEAWWHPFAPLTKNLPILVLLALLWGNTPATIKRS